MRHFDIRIEVRVEESNFGSAVYAYYWHAPAGEQIQLDLPDRPGLVTAEKIVNAAQTAKRAYDVAQRVKKETIPPGGPHR